MEVVKAFNSNNLHTEIIIKGTKEEPLFRANDIAQVLDINNIRTSTLNFNETEKVVHSMNTPGGIQQVAFLTEKGLYKILFKSRKPIAEKFQNWVCEVVKEIRLSGQYSLERQLDQLQNTLEQVNKNSEKTIEKLKIDKELEKHNLLLREFATAGAIIYIIKVKSYENGEYVIKIGESRRGIESRYNEHKSSYEEAIILDCFSVKQSKDFESFIHNHNDIKFNQVKNLSGHENENELFLIGKNLTYGILYNIIKTNIKLFNETDYNTMSLNIETILNALTNQPQQLLEDKNTINQLLEIQKLLLQKITNLEKANKEILEKLNSSQTRTTTNFGKPLPTLGPRLQKINPETLQLIKVYESVTECMNENSNIKRPSINKAIEENTVYHGFRWALVDRELDPNIIRYLQPTKETKIQNLGYIAKLDANKTEIMNVYLDRKTAAISNGYESNSALDTPVRNNTISNGHYYMLYEKCSDELREDFVERNHGEPLLYKDGVGQYDENNNLVREFSSKYDCIKTLHISDKTLAKCLDKNVVYNGHSYKYIGSKLSCFE
jgi:prophage antirepressor-like protein